MLVKGMIKDGELIKFEECDFDLENLTLQANLEKDIHIILSNLGLRQSNKGYVYLKDAIKKATEDYEYIDLITKAMYPYLAKKHHTTASRVESAIRHLIHTMPETEFRSKVFQYDMDRFSNKEFIVLIVNYIQYCH